MPKEASALVRQDVLLFAGAENHYVPNNQIYDQAGGSQTPAP